MRTDKLTVLILEDTPADAELIANALRGANLEFTAVQVNHEQEFCLLLQKVSPDLIFADNALLIADGKSALSTSRSLHPAVPFIVISDTPGEEAAVEAVRRGATDYILKQGFARLGPAVQRALQEGKRRCKTRGSLAHACWNEHADHDPRICELNQLLRAIREINKLILRERDPQILLADACSILIRTRGYLHVGIGLVETRARHVPPITRSSREAEYLDSFSVLWSGNADAAVPARPAIHSGVSWASQDIEKDPRFAPWREPAMACGCASVAAVPLVHWGEVMGAMTVCSDRVNTFDHEEIRLLEQLAGDLAFALEGIRHDQAHRSAEARLHLVSSALESTANSIAITDLKGNVLWTNPAFTQLTGYTLDEVRGKNTNILKSGKHEPEFYREMWQTIVGGRVWRSEIINRRKDGSLYTEECTITPVRDGNGQIENFIAVKQDITERKRTEEALRQSQQAYASLVNTVDGIVWEADAQTFKFSFVSKQAERLLGYPTEEWISNPNFWQEHIHPEDREMAVNFCVTATREMRDHDFQYRMIASDGREVWLRDLVAVVVEDGRPTKLRGIMVDITQSRLAEEALRWRTAFFEALVDSSLDGILVVDSQRKKILQNRRLNELWKIPPEIADDPDDCRQVEFVKTHVKNPQQFAEQVTHLYAETSEVHRAEIETTDGTVLERYSSPVQDRNGTYYGRIWAFRDITEQRQLEAKFRQAQKMEAVGQLAGGVAHDFNNILTAVMMYLGLLRTTLNDPEAADSLKELETQVKRAADLTKQLLMFSRKSAIEVKPLDLNQIVEEMRKMLQRLLGEHVQVEFVGAAGLPMVEADLGMLQQVIMNLSVNGRDAMPEGGRLTISTALADIDEQTAGLQSDRRTGRYVRLSVSDTGCGMDEKTRKRIFEPFFTTKELGKGTGLGLATVYGIAQQHHGWIEVTSEPGNGSTFDVFIPITEKSHSSNRGESSAAASGGRETILLVEDEPMVRLVTARRLQMSGYRVLEATDGKMAMELWRRHGSSVQMLLTDMIMPFGVSGLELARQFQKEKPDLKVIIMSGYGKIRSGDMPEDPRICYLTKPFEAVNLTKTIRTCLDQKTI